MGSYFKSIASDMWNAADFQGFFYQNATEKNDNYQNITLQKILPLYTTFVLFYKFFIWSAQQFIDQ